MRSIFITLSILFIAGCSNDKITRYADGEVTFCEGTGIIKGNITSFKESVYEVVNKFDEIEIGELDYVRIMYLDDSVRINKCRVFNKRGELNYQAIYKYHNCKCIGYTNSILNESFIIKSNNKNKEIWEYAGSKNNIFEIAIRCLEFDKNIPIFNKSDTILITNGDKHITSYKFMFDTFNNLTQYIFDDISGELKIDSGGEIIHNIYDKNNNLIKDLYYTYKYIDFDDKGNWIKRISYHNDEPDKITIREITYK